METEAIDWESGKNDVPGGTDKAIRDTLISMRDRGVKFLYGRWLIEGAPKVLLFDTGSVWGRLDEWKTDLWNLVGIPTPQNDTETNETILFGYLTAWFLGEVRHFSLSSRSAGCYSFWWELAATHDFSFLPSSLCTRERELLLLTFTNGKPVSCLYFFSRSYHCRKLITPSLLLLLSFSLALCPTLSRSNLISSLVHNFKCFKIHLNRSRTPSLSQASSRCHHNLHHPRNSPWTLPLCRISRFLQQPSLL